jgi:hypothetical protein
LAQSLDERDMGRILLALGRHGVLRFPDQHLDLQGRGDVVSRSDLGRICPTCITVTATTPGGMNLAKAGSEMEPLRTYNPSSRVVSHIAEPMVCTTLRRRRMDSNLRFRAR